MKYILCASADFEFVQIKIERIIGRGDAKDVICNAVQKFEADTLVMGTHSYGFFKR
jgi:nucleotide-binding universal stress UspA family protein